MQLTGIDTFEHPHRLGSPEPMNHSSYAMPVGVAGRPSAITTAIPSCALHATFTDAPAPIASLGSRVSTVPSGASNTWASAVA
ncbi:MAG: hypothetical protein R2713_01890 [Ilumatobacteraceae bacterium]